MRTSPLRAAARGARRRGLPLLAIVPAALALTAGSALAESSDTGSHDFTTPGCGGVGGVTANQFTVPAGVTRMSVVIRGEQGGMYGGMGAELEGEIAVTAGETLYACVAEGGGLAGAGDMQSGSRGGGYALLSRVAALDIPLGVAGGGGGYGGGPGGNGGDASMIWETQAPAGLPRAYAGAGLGGSTAAGGGSAGLNSRDSLADGAPGGRLAGGNGGAGTYGGGGGGGGAFGGGGGAATVGVGNGTGAGGGGGLSTCAMTDCLSRLSNAGGLVRLSWAVPTVATPTTTTVSIDNATPNRDQEINLTATVAPAPTGGSVEFQLDGQTIYGCETREVDDTTGTATCRYSAPSDPGEHLISAFYTGTSAFADSSHEDVPFTVVSSAISVSPSGNDFGEVELGKSATRQFTVTNSGTGSLTIDASDGIYLSERLPRDRPGRSADFSAVDDLCSGRTLAASASCTVTVKFSPSALGTRRGNLIVESDAWDGGDPVDLTGVGIEARPEERQPEPETRQPETRQPETPTAPTTPAQTPTAPAPAAPTPSKPVETARAPPAIGASSPLAPGRPAVVTQAGDVRLPLLCPPGLACSVSGTLTLAITGGQARASAKVTRVLVRFSGVKLAAGKTKTLSLKLPASFVKAQQKKGVRKLHTTLTVNTVLGSGQRITRRQSVTLLIPRARVAQRAAPRAAERPSFTG